MSEFYAALHPDDVPESHKGEYDEDADTAVTEWFGGRQARLDEVEEITDADDF